jgi:hypothetical protein
MPTPLRNEKFWHQSANCTQLQFDDYMLVLSLTKSLKSS